MHINPSNAEATFVQILFFQFSSHLFNHKCISEHNFFKIIWGSTPANLESAPARCAHRDLFGSKFWI